MTFITKQDAMKFTMVFSEDLLVNPLYSKLKPADREAYNLIYNRLNGSIHNDWFDNEFNAPYVIYTLEEMSAKMNISERSVTRIRETLVNAGLIFVKTIRRGATRIFVNLPKSSKQAISKQSAKTELDYSNGVERKEVKKPSLEDKMDSIISSLANLSVTNLPSPELRDSLSYALPNNTNNTSNTVAGVSDSGINTFDDQDDAGIFDDELIITPNLLDLSDESKKTGIPVNALEIIRTLSFGKMSKYDWVIAQIWKAKSKASKDLGVVGFPTLFESNDTMSAGMKSTIQRAITTLHRKKHNSSPQGFFFTTLYNFFKQAMFVESNDSDYVNGKPKILVA